jgi:salicylate hydroxylase
MAIDRVAVIGAGIAGLTAALSFARHGIASDIFEEAAELIEVGAGLQISPNASYVLSELGILGDLEATWTEPDEIRLMSGRSLRPLAQVPAGPFARERWHHPYGVLHRATLQRVLVNAVRANPLCRIWLNTAVRGTVRDKIHSLTGARHALIVGADGVWSGLRAAVPESPTPVFSGNIAWRFVVQAKDAPDWLRKDAVSAFLGPSAHMVSYPLKEKNSFNLVAIASGISPGETWNAEADPTQKRLLLQQFKGWSPDIEALLAKAQQPSFWPLYQVTPGRWHNGHDMVLIGDAAHAMMPFAAQGAAMAIEDAFTLANRVAAFSSLQQALSAFETERAARIAKVRARGAFNRFAYHARGPFRLGRDMVLSLRPPQSLAADLDWLYGFRAD